MDLRFENLETRLLSPKLWKGFAPPIGGTFPGTASGNPVIGLFDDFNGFGRTGPLASSVGYYQSNGISYKSFEDDDQSIRSAVPTTTPAVDANGPGVIQLYAGDTAHDDAVIQAGGNVATTMCPFNVIRATAKELVFECRFKYDNLTAARNNFFIGLFGTGAAANNGWLADSATAVTELADNDLIGFTRTPNSGTSALLFVYDRVGGTTGAHATTIHTLVADTYVKVGFRWNASRKTCHVYANGEPVATVAAAATNATPWPTLYMNFLAGLKHIATTRDSMYIDWWACAQMM